MNQIPHGDDREDELHEARVQRTVDAEAAGEAAGRRGLAADLCPHFHFEPEYAAWHRGRLRTLPSLRRGQISLQYS